MALSSVQRVNRRYESRFASAKGGSPAGRAVKKAQSVRGRCGPRSRAPRRRLYVGFCGGGGVHSSGLSSIFGLEQRVCGAQLIVVLDGVAHSPNNISWSRKPPVSPTKIKTHHTKKKTPPPPPQRLLVISRARASRRRPCLATPIGAAHHLIGRVWIPFGGERQSQVGGVYWVL